MNLSDIVTIWFAGLQRMFSGPAGDKERVDAARQSSARVKGLKSSVSETSAASAISEGGNEVKSPIDRVRDYEKLPPPTSNTELSNHRLEALSAKLSEGQA